VHDGDDDLPVVARPAQRVSLAKPFQLAIGRGSPDPAHADECRCLTEKVDVRLGNLAAREAALGEIARMTVVRNASASSSLESTCGPPGIQDQRRHVQMAQRGLRIERLKGIDGALESSTAMNRTPPSCSIVTRTV